MARSLNKITIIGNLGRDPEIRYLPSGKPVANFSVAVSRTTRPPEGEAREETEWFRVEAWDRLGETCAEYLKKGSKVYVEGRLRTREYEDRAGQKRTAVEIVANDMLMLDARPAADGGEGEAAGERSARAPVAANARPGPAAGPARDLDDGGADEMPFD
jgi:single-strand DNA-binding protein